MVYFPETKTDFGTFKAEYDRHTIAPGETIHVKCTVKIAKTYEGGSARQRMIVHGYSGGDNNNVLFTVNFNSNVIIPAGVTGRIEYDIALTDEQYAAFDSDAIELRTTFACYLFNGNEIKFFRDPLDLAALKKRRAPDFYPRFSDYIVDGSAQYADDGTVLRKNVKTYFGDFVQGYSKLQLDMGVNVDIVPWEYGELTLKSAKLRFGLNTEVSVPITEGSIETYMYILEYPIGEYGIAGDIPFTLTVEDSMGYKSTLEGSVTIMPYMLPTISAFAVARYVSDQDNAGNPVYYESIEGEKVWIDATGQVSPVAGKNTWTATVTRTSSDSSMAAVIDSGDDGRIFGFVNDRGLFTGDVSNAVGHTFVLTLSDWITENFGISIQRTVFVPNADFVYTYNRYGWAVGMKTNATEADRRFEVGEKHGAYFHGGIKKLGAGWQELTLVNGKTPATYGGGVLRCRKIENKCIITGSVEVKPSSSTLALADLPEGFVPAYNVFSLNACSGGRIARIAAYSNEEANTVDTRGKLVLTWVKDISDGDNYTSAAIWIQCSIEYWVDSEDA